MQEFDFIIIGAGSAGCVVADVLSRDGRFSVAVIEAGGSDNRFWIKVPMGYGRLFQDPSVNWKFETEAEAACNNRKAYWPRGKVIGGSSSINALVYCRGMPRDFDDWKRGGADGWGWSDVRPHFEMIERRISPNGSEIGSGPLSVSNVSNCAHPVNKHFLDGAAEIGLPQTDSFNGEAPEGVGYYEITTKRGIRCSTADAFLRPALKRNNVTLIANALVRKLLFDGKAVDGIEIVQKGVVRQIRVKREVVISAGAIGSPQLLQVSGIGPAKLLAKHGVKLVQDNKNVGGNLQDHLAVSYYYKANTSTLNDELSSHTGKLWAGLKYVFARRGPLSLSLNQCGGFVRSSASVKNVDMQLYFSPLTFGNDGSGKNSRINPDPFSGFLVSFQPARPTSRGRVNICSPDIAVPPEIRPNYLSSQNDIDEVLAGAHLVQSLVRTAAIKSITARAVSTDVEKMTDEEILVDFRARCGTVFHPVSTCKMGISNVDSVVGLDMRVHGIDGLRVIDASVFPTVTSGNTNAPTIMLAHKAACEMVQEIRSEGLYDIHSTR